MPRAWHLFSDHLAFPSLPFSHQCVAHVPPFSILEKFYFFSLVFGQNYSSQDANFQNFLFPTALIFQRKSASQTLLLEIRAAHTYQKKSTPHVCIHMKFQVVLYPILKLAN